MTAPLNLLLFSSLIVLLFLAPACHALTQYVAENVTLTVESVPACHLYGDPDLYGRGVRASFYTTWGAGIIGIAFGATHESKSLRLSFNILLSTLLIILARNANRGSFALFEWYIVTTLSLYSYSVFAIIMPHDFIRVISEDSGVSGDDGSDGRSGKPDSPQGTTSADDATDAAAQTVRKTKREAKQERIEEQAQERADRVFRAGLYNDPIGFGFLLLVNGALNCCLPWLHFTKADSGHKEGCPVPIFLFGTWDMYNPHWQGFLKFNAIFGLLILGIGSSVLGLRLIVRGIEKREVYSRTLILMEERRFNGFKLMRMNAEKVKRALEADDSGGRETEQIRGRAQGLLMLRDLVEWAHNQAQRAALSEEQARVLIAEVLERINDQKKDRWTNRTFRWGSSFLFALIGGLGIWCIERTIELNQIDMEDDIGSSTGQLLALLVAALTTVAFFWELFTSWLDRKEAKEEAEEIAAYIAYDAMEYHQQATGRKDFFQRVGDYLSTLRPSHVAQPQATAPASSSLSTTLAALGLTRFGSIFSGSRREQAAGSAV